MNVSGGHFISGLFSLLGDEGKFGRIWSARRQNNIKYTQWRMNKYMYNYMYNFTYIFLYFLCNKNIKYQQ